MFASHVSENFKFAHIGCVTEKLQQTIILDLFASKILSKCKNYLSYNYTEINLMVC